jgi:hypothetical protein
LNFRLKNEAEAISVRKGCTLEAFDDSNFTDDKVFSKKPLTKKTPYSVLKKKNFI